MRRIGKITGRSDDMLIIRGVNVFPTQIEEQVLENQTAFELYEIICIAMATSTASRCMWSCARHQYLDEGQRKQVVGELASRSRPISASARKCTLAVGR
jgi:phenylacetate-CoA ligase